MKKMNHVIHHFVVVDVINAPQVDVYVHDSRGLLICKLTSWLMHQLMEGVTLN